MCRIKIKLLTIILLVFACVACEREFDETIVENNDLNGSALYKVFNLSPGSKGTMVYVNDSVRSGAALAYGLTFPSSGTGFTLAGGTRNITVRDTFSSTIQPPINESVTVENGRRYYLFLYDTVNAIKRAILASEAGRPLDTSALLSFGNFIFSSTPVANVDLFSVRLNRNLFTDVTIGQVLDFIPYPSNTVDTLIVRTTGTSVTLASAPFQAAEKRSYNLVFRGRYQTTTPATAALVRSLTAFGD